VGAQNPPGDPSGLAAPFTVTAKPLNPKYTVEVPVTVKGPPGSPFPVPVKVELENWQAVPLQSALQSIPGPTGPQPTKLLVPETTE
jgi:hypothetical protein